MTNTPPGASTVSMPARKSSRSGICGKVFVAVMTEAGPHRRAISAAVLAPKKPTNRSIPFAAVRAARFSAGSTPSVSHSVPAKARQQCPVVAPDVDDQISGPEPPACRHDVAELEEMRPQGVRGRGHVQVILEHRRGRHDLRQLHVTAAVADNPRGAETSAPAPQLVPREELVGERGMAQVKEFPDPGLETDDTRLGRPVDSMVAPQQGHHSMTMTWEPCTSGRTRTSVSSDRASRTDCWRAGGTTKSTNPPPPAPHTFPPIAPASRARRTSDRSRRC